MGVSFVLKSHKIVVGFLLRSKPHSNYQGRQATDPDIRFQGTGFTIVNLQIFFQCTTEHARLMEQKRNPGTIWCCAIKMLNWLLLTANSVSSN
jgi:hypothetical protein